VNLYNPNLDAFVASSFLFEFSPVGGIEPNYRIIAFEWENLANLDKAPVYFLNFVIVGFVCKYA
jgi:hypothetical protein